MSKYRIVEGAWKKENYLKRSFKGKLVEPFFKKNPENIELIWPEIPLSLKNSINTGFERYYQDIKKYWPGSKK